MGWCCLHSIRMEVMSMVYFSFQDLMSFGIFIVALLTFIFKNKK
ncbi:putative holin-like toxin [Phascolarctobacterium succinatutens]